VPTGQRLESHFISANRTAIRILGFKPDEVVGTVGMSLVADVRHGQGPSASQRRARRAYPGHPSRPFSELV